MSRELFEENKRLSEKEFSEGRPRLDCLPQVLITFATDNCNLRCVGCHYGKRVGKKIAISEQGYKRVFAAFPYLNNLMITGAEMFFDAGNPEHYVHKLFAEGLKYPHLRFIGVTNGSLISPERARMIADQFEKIGISIDSPDPEIYKTIRVGSNLPLVAGNIRMISGIKSERGLGRADQPAIYLNFIIMERTYRDLLKMVEFARDTGALVVTLQAPWKDTYTDENIFNDTERTAEYLELRNKASALAGELGIRIQDRTRNTIMKHMPQFRDTLEFSENTVMEKWPQCCRLPWQELYITESGDVMVCCTSNTILGNINQQSISEIWNSREMMSLRKRIMKGNYIKDCKINCCRGYVLPDHYRKAGLRSLLTSVFTGRE